MAKLATLCQRAVYFEKVCEVYGENIGNRVQISNMMPSGDAWTKCVSVAEIRQVGSGFEYRERGVFRVDCI